MMCYLLGGTVAHWSKEFRVCEGRLQAILMCISPLSHPPEFISVLLSTPSDGALPAAQMLYSPISVAAVRAAEISMRLRKKSKREGFLLDPHKHQFKELRRFCGPESDDTNFKTRIKKHCKRAILIRKQLIRHKFVLNRNLSTHKLLTSALSSIWW